MPQESSPEQIAATLRCVGFVPTANLREDGERMMQWVMEEDGIEDEEQAKRRMRYAFCRLVAHPPHPMDKTAERALQFITDAFTISGADLDAMWLETTGKGVGGSGEGGLTISDVLATDEPFREKAMTLLMEVHVPMWQLVAAAVASAAMIYFVMRKRSPTP